MNKLSKSDRILLEKAIRARAVKDQSNAIKNGNEYVTSSLSPVNKVRALKYIQSTRGSTSSGSRSMKSFDLHQTASADALDEMESRDPPQIRPSSAHQLAPEATSTSTSDNPNKKIDATELSQQALTPAAALRKLTIKTNQKFKTMGKLVTTSPEPDKI
jgi:hypothetical protein